MARKNAVLAAKGYRPRSVEHHAARATKTFESLEVRGDPTSMHLRYSLGRHSRLWEFGLLHSLW